MYKYPLQQYYLLMIERNGHPSYFDYFWRDIDNSIWRDIDSDEWSTY